MDSKIIFKLLFVIFFFLQTQLNAIEFKGKFLQGHYIIGITDPSAEIIIDKKCVDLCGCCYHDLIKSHVEDCLNDIVHNLTNDTSFCEQKCSTNSSFL